MMEENKYESLMMERLVRLETKMDIIIGARDIANNASVSASSAHKRVDKIEGNQTWLWRTVMASIIVTLITLLASTGSGT